MDDQQLQTVITMLMGALDTALSRITNLDARITALEHPAHPDDVRDALRDLDALSAGEPTPAPRLWKLNNFPADDSCRWFPDGDGAWQSDCGGKWMFPDGTPYDNNMLHCPFCGRHATQMLHERVTEGGK